MSLQAEHSTKSDPTVEPSELLSALLDGELSAAELDRLLGDFDKSEALRGRWQRFCALKAAREGVRLRSSVDICAGVMAALADAPAPASDTRVVPLPERSRRPAPTFSWRTTAGIAAAASMAAVVVVGGVQRQLHAGAYPATASVATVASAPAVTSSLIAAADESARKADAAITSVAPQQVADSEGSRLDPEARRRLDDYVIEHSSYSGGGLSGSPLGYARFAAETANYQPADGQH